MTPISARSLGSLSTPAQLIPPRGYRVLAWIGLIANGLTIPLAVSYTHLTLPTIYSV